MVAQELRAKLLAEIQNRCVKRGAEFKLASGQLSTIYVDCKGMTLHAPSLKTLCGYFWDTWKSIAKNESELPGAIAGVSVGGDPLAAGLALEALNDKREVDILLVRKESKAHGGSEGRAVEGKSSDLLAGKLVLVEDVLSTGGSSAKALQFLKLEGYRVRELWAIVDREMGALDKIQNEFGIPAKALFRLSEL